MLEAGPVFQLCSGSFGITMFSSVTGSRMKCPADGTYWQANVTRGAMGVMTILHDTPSDLIEIGPSDALDGSTS